MFAEFVEGGTTINFRPDGLGFSEAPSILVGAEGKSIAQILTGTPFRNNSGPPRRAISLPYRLKARLSLLPALAASCQMENKLALDA